MRIPHLFGSMAVLFVSSFAFAEDKKMEKFEDATFIKKAASGGMHEVELGKLAEKMGHSDGVKEFGKKMQTDHTKANLKLLEIAKTLNVDVPDKMMEKHQKEYDKFKDLKGEAFDKAYIDHMVKDHEMDVKEFTKASKEAKNAELKAFAADTLKVVTEHYEMIKKMQK